MPIADFSFTGERVARELSALIGHKVTQVINSGSSLKFCHVAECSADLYPRQERTMGWDPAAGQAVAEAVGAAVLCLEDRSPLSHGKNGLDNPHFIVGQASLVDIQD